jgi:uncharacterized protein
MTIMDALMERNTSDFVRLLEQVKDVNALDDRGWTLLNWAAGSGNTSFADILLKRGADIFRRGRDNRTPYLIALAAGHVDTAKHLKEIEEKNGGDKDCTSSRQQQRRAYCRAYRAGSLRAFSAWHAIAQEPADRPSDDAYVFLHQDFTVTSSVLHAGKVLCAAPTEEWKHFCTHTLGFHVPTDFELLSLG